MRILFTDNHNGHCYKNPEATLVRVIAPMSKKQLKESFKEIENKQPGVSHIGGS